MVSLVFIIGYLILFRTIVVYGDFNLPVTSCSRQLEQFVCALQTDLQGVIINKWYHDYGNELSVELSIAWLGERKTTLIMALEDFDNNTKVYNTLYVTDIKITITSEKSHIHLFAIKSGKYSGATTLKYGPTKDVMFDCQKYLQVGGLFHLRIGIINITENRISLYDQRRIKKKFNMADNGTILFCLFYVIDYGVQEIQIKRFVKSKTILIYDGPLDFIPSEKSSSDLIFIVSTAIVLAIVAVAVLVIVVKKRCENKSHSQNPSPINFEVFYLNLLFRKECDQELREIDELYEEIN